MSLWLPVLAATAGAYALKLAGFLVPPAWMAHPRFNHVASLLPVGLLAGLIAQQTLGSGQAIVFDGRLLGAGVALVALRLRAPFIVVVALAAAVTAVARHYGLVA